MPWPQRIPPSTSRWGGLASVLLVGGIFYLSDPGMFTDNQPLIRFEKRPELRNIQQLRGVRLEQLTPCRLPQVATPASGTVAASTDGTFKMLLSTGWARIHIDTSTANFHSPEVTYKNPAVGVINIRRVTNGAEGREFRADSLANPLPVELQCELSNDSAGSIWTFYNIAERYPYSALADAITPQGKRHKFSIDARTSASRDSLASLLATAVLNQRP